MKAELDADAWSRGMGESTYLTDVKDRQMRSEAQDVGTLESNYASTLAGHLYDAMKSQQEAKVEVDKFNAEQINAARQKAMSAAQSLYQSYLTAAKTGGSGSGGGGRTGGSKPAADPEADEETPTLSGPTFLQQLLRGRTDDGLPKTDYKTAANMLARMSAAQRRKLYNRADPTYLELRAELMYSLGSKGFAQLMQEFPA